MGRKIPPKTRKVKNLGGERLKEWRIRKEFGLVSSHTKTSSGKTSDVDSVTSVSMSNLRSSTNHQDTTDVSNNIGTHQNPENSLNNSF